MKNNSVGVSGIYLSDFCGVNSFRLQRRLSGDKAAAAHGGNGWLAVEFGTPTVVKLFSTNLKCLRHKYAFALASLGA